MANAQLVAEEMLEMCRHKTLLALRRSVLPATPIRSSRKLELIADIAAECDTSAVRQRIFEEVLVDWPMRKLRLFIARMRGSAAWAQWARVLVRSLGVSTFRSLEPPTFN